MMLDQETERLLVEAARYMRSRYFGKYQGIVKEVGQGENLGQIRALVPEIYGEEETDLSPWAMPCVPFAGPDHGFMVLPEVDDGVWIEFMEGDISSPIWTGCWFVNDEIVEPGSPQVRTLVTTAGHKLILDDEQNQVRILHSWGREHSGGAEMTMTENDITLKIGSAQIVLSKSGSVNINNGAFEVK